MRVSEVTGLRKAGLAVQAPAPPCNPEAVQLRGGSASRGERRAPVSRAGPCEVGSCRPAGAEPGFGVTRSARY